MSLSGKSVNYMEGLPYLGEGFEIKPEPNSKGYGELQAIDVDTGKKVWSHWSKLPWNGGVATTAGGLAFSGSLDGHLYAFDETTGKVSGRAQAREWHHRATFVYEIDGKEYVAILAGYGGANPIWGGPMAKAADKVPRGGTLYVFALNRTNRIITHLILHRGLASSRARGAHRITGRTDMNHPLNSHSRREHAGRMHRARPSASDAAVKICTFPGSPSAALDRASRRPSSLARTSRRRSFQTASARATMTASRSRNSTRHSRAIAM